MADEGQVRTSLWELLTQSRVSQQDAHVFLRDLAMPELVKVGTVTARYISTPRKTCTEHQKGFCSFVDRFTPFLGGHQFGRLNT